MSNAQHTVITPSTPMSDLANSPPNASALMSWLTARMAASPLTCSGRARFRTLWVVHRLRRMFGAPFVTYELEGSDLVMPATHALPWLRRSHPQYSANIGCIGRHVLAKYPDLRAVDIGANIGDTVALMRRHAAFPILCVEGEPRYLRCLEKNVQQWSDVKIERSYVGASTGTQSARVEFNQGTASIVPDSHGGAIARFRRLSDILQDHPGFERPKLIKIDTDGWDAAIVRSEVEFLSRIRPILFIEYDPRSAKRLTGNDGAAVLAELAHAGYAGAVVYNNFGDYLLTVELSNHQLLEDLHYHFMTSSLEAYADLCFFAEEDRDIAVRLRADAIKAT